MPALGVVPDTQNKKKKEQMSDGSTGHLEDEGQDEGAEANEPDGVVGAHADPVGDGAVLAHLLRQLLLDPEGLVRRLREQRSKPATTSEKHRSQSGTGHPPGKRGLGRGGYHRCG